MCKHFICISLMTLICKHSNVMILPPLELTCRAKKYLLWFSTKGIFKLGVNDIWLEVSCKNFPICINSRLNQ